MTKCQVPWVFFDSVHSQFNSAHEATLLWPAVLACHKAMNL